MDNEEWMMVGPGSKKRKCTDRRIETDTIEATRKLVKVRRADERRECDIIEAQSEMSAASAISLDSSCNTVTSSKPTTWPFADDVGATRGQLPLYKFLSSGYQIFASRHETRVGCSELYEIEEEQFPLHVGLKKTIPGHRHEPNSDEQLLRAIAPEEILRPRYRADKGENGGRLASTDEAELALFLMANRLRCRPYDIEAVYKWCDNLRETLGLDHIRSIGGPIADSLIEQMIPIAIKKEDLNMINVLLDYGFALTDLRCCTDGHTILHNASCQLPPLHFACHVGSLTGLGALLDRTCDPNQLFPIQLLPSITPMDCALTFKRKWPHQNVKAEQIIQKLIDVGVSDGYHRGNRNGY